MPVLDVARSKEFFTTLGFSVNEQFSGSDNVCVVVNSSISLMLMNHEKFSAFIDKEVAPKSSSEVILSFSCESAEEVRIITEKAFSLGARKINEQALEANFLFIYPPSFEELRKRIGNRIETEAEFKLRIKEAIKQIEFANKSVLFTNRLVNDGLDEAKAEVFTLVEALYF